MAEDHLSAETRAMLGRPAAERLAWFQTEFWIKYPASDAILARLEELVNKPRRARMPGYLVTSESNNGKTSIAMRFAGLHPPVFSEADNKMQMPVMLLEVVPTPTEAAIIERILSILGIPYRLTDPVPDKREAAIVAMRIAGLQLLMLDELQKILGARLEQRRAVMDALRYIANQVPVPVVAFSTPRGTGGLASSDEMINRLRPLTLPTWKLDADFQRLLLSFEEHMPLPERSGLGKKAMAALIHTLSEGLVGEVYDLLELALSVALASDAPRIDETLLRGLAWTPPVRPQTLGPRRHAMRVRGNRWSSVPPPQPDELMSSWLHRLARANGRSDHTLCSMMFGPVPLLTRDLDLTMPVALLPVLSEWTGISECRLSELLLTTLQGKVTGESRTGTGCRWVLPLGVYHRVRRHHGLQYCPKCLAEPIAYARKQWRYAFVTECLEHERPLLDRCPACASPFMFHRMHPDRGQRWGCATCGEALNKPDASVGSKCLLRRQQARLVAAAGSGGARMNCRWVSSLTLFNGYRFLVHTLTSSRLKHLANTAIITRDGTLRPSGTHTEFERMGIYLRRPIMLALATWMTDWPDCFLRDVRSSCSSRSVLMGDRRHIPFWIQEALDTLPTAQPHRLTSQEVQSCARWLRAGGEAISFEGLCRALSLSTWERMLPANRVLLAEGVFGLD